MHMLDIILSVNTIFLHFCQILMFHNEFMSHHVLFTKDTWWSCIPANRGYSDVHERPDANKVKQDSAVLGYY